MPIKGRIDMLTTGIRTPVGVKIFGADIREIERLGAEIEQLLPAVQGTRGVFAERTGGGSFLDLEWRRDALARCGMSIYEAQMAVTAAVGGENVTTTVKGRERYPVDVRHLRDFRGDPNALGRVLVPARNGQAQAPIAQLADIRFAAGPSMYRNEDGMLTGYVFVDVAGRDVAGYLVEAKRVVRGKVKMPPGCGDLMTAIMEGAVKRIAAPMVGGILTSFVLELVVYPAVHEVWKWNFELKRRLSSWRSPRRWPRLNQLRDPGATQ